jgi:hypothetical protein
MMRPMSAVLASPQRPWRDVPRGSAPRGRWPGRGSAATRCGDQSPWSSVVARQRPDSVGAEHIRRAQGAFATVGFYSWRAWEAILMTSGKPPSRACRCRRTSVVGRDPHRRGNAPGPTNPNQHPSSRRRRRWSPVPPGGQWRAKGWHGRRQKRRMLRPVDLATWALRAVTFPSTHPPRSPSHWV